MIGMSYVLCVHKIEFVIIHKECIASRTISPSSPSLSLPLRHPKPHHILYRDFTRRTTNDIYKEKVGSQASATADRQLNSQRPKPKLYSKQTLSQITTRKKKPYSLHFIADILCHSHFPKVLAFFFSLPLLFLLLLFCSKFFFSFSVSFSPNHHHHHLLVAANASVCKRSSDRMRWTMESKVAHTRTNS